MTKWHVVHAYQEEGEDGLFYDIYHGKCAWSVHYHPTTVDQHGKILSQAWFHQDYSCDVAYHVDNVGHDGFPTAEGWYQLRIVTERIRGFDWTEIDQWVEYEPLKLEALETL